MGISNLVRGRSDFRLAEYTSGIDFCRAHYEVNVSANKDSESVDSVTPQKQQHVNPGAVMGVQKAEAAAMAWSKQTAYMTYALIWVSFFILALQSAISSNVIHSAYASFEDAPSVGTANILSNVISGVLKLPIGRLLSIWGRTEGFLFFIVVYVVGLIILAACNSPASYSVGYVLYWIGYDALYLILDVFIADTSGMRNRAFAFGFASTPFICTAFTGPLAAQSFVETASWRWAYGTFAIVAPAVMLPLAAHFRFYQKKAQRMTLYCPQPSGRTPVGSLIHYAREFDIIGAFFLMAAFVLLLLPFSLTSVGHTAYKSGTFIGMLAASFVAFGLFGVWERYYASSNFIQWSLFNNRSVIGACVSTCALFFSYYCWELYFYNFCMVVYGLSISMTGYVGQIYNVGSCFWSAVFGILVYVTRQFKYTCLGFGLPLVLLGAGLMIHFRSTENGGIGYIVMCQIFIAFGGGTLVIGQDMAVMAAADREYIPMMLSLIGLFSSLGAAIGSAVSSAIYTNTFPASLHEALPAAHKDEYLAIYKGGYTKQLQYPVGSEIRTAISHAYGVYMTWGCVAAVAIMGLAIPAVACWRNFRVDNDPDNDQSKGNVI